jgi:hypothetical protein
MFYLPTHLMLLNLANVKVKWHFCKVFWICCLSVDWSCFNRQEQLGASFGVITAKLLWNMTLCRWDSSFRRFEGWGTIPKTARHIPQDCLYIFLIILKFWFIRTVKFLIWLLLLSKTHDSTT